VHLRYIQLEVRIPLSCKRISGVCNVVSGNKFMRAFFLFSPLFAFGELRDLTLAPRFRRVVVEIVRSQLSWLRDWFWRRDLFLCSTVVLHRRKQV